MFSKIMYVASLVVIFLCELLGVRHYLHAWHKGRLIDTVIAALLVIACIVIVVIFSKAYDYYFHILN